MLKFANLRKSDMNELAWLWMSWKFNLIEEENMWQSLSQRIKI